LSPEAGAKREGIKAERLGKEGIGASSIRFGRFGGHDQPRSSRKLALAVEATRRKMK